MNPFLNMAAMGPYVASTPKMPKFDWQGLLGDAGAMMTQQAAAAPQQAQGALPQAPAIPVNVTDLNPLYDFTRFRFGGGAPQGPFGR